MGKKNRNRYDDMMEDHSDDYNDGYDDGDNDDYYGRNNKKSKRNKRNQRDQYSGYEGDDDYQYGNRYDDEYEFEEAQDDESEEDVQENDAEDDQDTDDALNQDVSWEQWAAEEAKRHEEEEAQRRAAQAQKEAEEEELKRLEEAERRELAAKKRAEEEELKRLEEAERRELAAKKRAEEEELKRLIEAEHRELAAKKRAEEEELKRMEEEERRKSEAQKRAAEGQRQNTPSAASDFISKKPVFSFKTVQPAVSPRETSAEQIKLDSSANSPNFSKPDTPLASPPVNAQQDADDFNDDEENDDPYGIKKRRMTSRLLAGLRGVGSKGLHGLSLVFAFAIACLTFPFRLVKNLVKRPSQDEALEDQQNDQEILASSENSAMTKQCVAAPSDISAKVESNSLDAQDPESSEMEPSEKRSFWRFFSPIYWGKLLGHGLKSVGKIVLFLPLFFWKKSCAVGRWSKERLFCWMKNDQYEDELERPLNAEASEQAATAMEQANVSPNALLQPKNDEESLSPLSTSSSTNPFRSKIRLFSKKDSSENSPEDDGKEEEEEEAIENESWDEEPTTRQKWVKLAKYTGWVTVATTLILCVGSGGYYFLITARQQNDPLVASNAPEASQDTLDTQTPQPATELSSLEGNNLPKMGNIPQISASDASFSDPAVPASVPDPFSSALSEATLGTSPPEASPLESDSADSAEDDTLVSSSEKSSPSIPADPAIPSLNEAPEVADAETSDSVPIFAPETASSPLDSPAPEESTLALAAPSEAEDPSKNLASEATPAPSSLLPEDGEEEEEALGASFISTESPPLDTAADTVSDTAASSSISSDGTKPEEALISDTASDTVAGAPLTFNLTSSETTDSAASSDPTASTPSVPSAGSTTPTESAPPADSSTLTESIPSTNSVALAESTNSSTPPQPTVPLESTASTPPTLPQKSLESPIPTFSTTGTEPLAAPLGTNELSQAANPVLTSPPPFDTASNESTDPLMDPNLLSNANLDTSSPLLTQTMSVDPEMAGPDLSLDQSLDNAYNDVAQFVNTSTDTNAAKFPQTNSSPNDLSQIDLNNPSNDFNAMASELTANSNIAATNSAATPNFADAQKFSAQNFTETANFPEASSALPTANDTDFNSQFAQQMQDVNSYLNQNAESLNTELNQGIQNIDTRFNQGVDQLNNYLQEGSNAVQQEMANINTKIQNGAESVNRFGTELSNGYNELKTTVSEGVAQTKSTLDQSYQQLAETGGQIRSDAQNVYQQWNDALSGTAPLANTANTTSVANTASNLDTLNPSNLSVSPQNSTNSGTTNTAESTPGMLAADTAAPENLASSNLPSTLQTSTNNLPTTGEALASNGATPNANSAANLDSNVTTQPSMLTSESFSQSLTPFSRYVYQSDDIVSSTLSNQGEHLSANANSIVPPHVSSASSQASSNTNAANASTNSIYDPTALKTAQTSTGAAQTASGTGQVATGMTQTTFGTAQIASTTAQSTVDTSNYRLYTTKKDENLLTIADSVLGDTDRWAEIKRLNAETLSTTKMSGSYFPEGTTLWLPKE